MAETVLHRMAMGAAHALCEFSLLESQQHHSEQFLKAPVDARKRISLKMGGFAERIISISAKALVDKLLARISYQLQEQKSFKLHSTREVQVYGAEKVTTTKQ